MKKTPRFPGSSCAANRESGIGIIEILVSIVLFGLIAMAFIPFLISNIKATARDTTIATATQFANERLNLVRSAAQSSCSAFIAQVNANPVPRTVQDARGVQLIITQLPDTLPAAHPCASTEEFTVEVRDTAGSLLYAEVSAKLRVAP